MTPVRIKICGLTTVDDALAAVDAGADYLGFNFYPPSPRCVTPADCAAMVAAVAARAPSVVCVGVFVNTPPAEVAALLDRCGLDLAQLHGDETPADVRALGGRAFRALRGAASPDLGAFAAAGPAAPALLVDAWSPGHYGGTGQTADWSAARALAGRYPLFLAGGLTPANIAGALRQVRPWGVDVASGVESAPGRKDVTKMRKFVEAVRETLVSE